MSCWLCDSMCSLVIVGCVGIEMKLYFILIFVNVLFSVCVVLLIFVRLIRWVFVFRDVMFIVMFVVLFGCFLMVFILIMGIGVFGEIW